MKKSLFIKMVISFITIATTLVMSGGYAFAANPATESEHTPYGMLSGYTYCTPPGGLTRQLTLYTKLSNKGYHLYCSFDVEDYETGKYIDSYSVNGYTDPLYLRMTYDGYGHAITIYGSHEVVSTNSYVVYTTDANV